LELHTPEEAEEAKFRLANEERRRQYFVGALSSVEQYAYAHGKMEEDALSPYGLQLSIAISLKRIADAAETLAIGVDRLRGVFRADKDGEYR
jgi:hypothetical protein